MTKIHSVAAVGAYWARDRILNEDSTNTENDNSFYDEASASAEIACGWEEIRESSIKSAKLVSHEIIFIFHGTSGKSITKRIVHQFDFLIKMDILMT